MHIQSLQIDPIKSLQGINLNSSPLINTGLQYDRQWMLIDEQNQFLSQRKLPQMACLKTHIEGSQLIVTNSVKESIGLELKSTKPANIHVTVWKDTSQASLEPDKINAWFSKQLNTPCRLVRLSNNHQRFVDTQYAKLKETVGFADGFPLLIVSASSLDLLNSKLKQPIDMNRFRPNIVVEGLEPHEEDSIQTLKINDIVINLVKPCSRCVIPSIDQKTGVKRDDILTTLLLYRKKGKKIYFGMNGLQENNGLLRVNDPVKILKK